MSCRYPYSTTEVSYYRGKDCQGNKSQRNDKGSAYLQYFIDGLSIHGLLVICGLVKGVSEGAEWKEFLHTDLPEQRDEENDTNLFLSYE